MELKNKELAEYEHLTTVIRQNEEVLARMFALLVTVSFAILAGVSGALKVTDKLANLWYVWTLLLPVPFSLSIFSVMVGVRRDIIRVGTYCQVFFGGSGSWEMRLSAFRMQRSEEANHSMIAAIALVCATSYAIFLMAALPSLLAAKATLATYVLFIGVPFTVTIIVGGILANLWLDVVKGQRQRFLQAWTDILKGR